MKEPLTKDELSELKTIGVIAANWYAVTYNETQMPFAIFDNEAYAIAYRDKFSATSIVEPWPMIVKDLRKGELTRRRTQHNPLHFLDWVVSNGWVRLLNGKWVDESEFEWMGENERLIESEKLLELYLNSLRDGGN